MSDENTFKAVHEMTVFVLSQTGVSYYEIKKYAFENSKHDWLKALNNKNTRMHISELCKSKSRKDGVPYRTFYGEPKEE